MDETRIDPSNRPDVAALAMTDDEIIGAMETALAIQDRGEAGQLTAEALHAERGGIVAGLTSGRAGEGGTVLLRHRGPSLADIALGHAMVQEVEALGIGRRQRHA